jgi:hypothetical protein
MKTPPDGASTTVTSDQPMTPAPLDEAEATRLATEAIDQIGGPRSVYRNPRMAFSFQSKRNVEIEGREVEVRYGEISTPAIATIEGWVFEIHDDHIELLMRPLKRRT